MSGRLPGRAAALLILLTADAGLSIATLWIKPPAAMRGNGAVVILNENHCTKRVRESGIALVKRRMPGKPITKVETAVR